MDKAKLHGGEYWELKIVSFSVLWILSWLINILTEILEGSKDSAESCEVFLGEQDLKLCNMLKGVTTDPKNEFPPNVILFWTLNICELLAAVI